MNQTDFGDMLGIAQNTLSEYERGIRPIPDNVAQSLSYRFRVSEHDFTYSDLSEYDVVFDSQKGYVPEINTIKQIMNSLFPVIAPDANSEDDSFSTG